MGNNPLGFAWTLALAIFGGASGAFAASSMRGSLGLTSSSVLTFIGLMVTTVGWFVSARLGEAAQRRMFLHTLINNARLDLVEHIRAEQDWLMNVRGLGFNLRLVQNRYEMSPRPGDPLREQLDWQHQRENAHAKLFRESSSRNLTMVLEEYESLFPETRHVRMQLGCRRLQILDAYGALLSELTNAATRAATIAAMEARLGTDTDYSAVLEDLRMHIQNASLAEITGRTIPPREPQNRNLPLMVVRPDGQLHVVENGEPWPILTVNTPPLLQQL